MSRRNHPAPRSARAVRGVLVAGLALVALTACGEDEPDGVGEEPAAGSTSAAATASASAATSVPASASTAAEPAPAESESESVTVTAVDFELQVDEDSFSAGSYEVTLVNEGGSTHDLVIERDGEVVAAADGIDPGQSTTVTVTLEPGEYVFYCSIADHRAMGMETEIGIT
ncbi:plastocyanin [Blastococcus colisei]|uniref:Plastocyanin n=1 Tax=Blastococcus colisei TaxID=1564162 RepID=A0A543PD44_9ACTN|nr:cupredoxin domain-containing protein [Blastococcus colisei]TQN42002.1 plastocyanin [Blastococcus colisei]